MHSKTVREVLTAHHGEIAPVVPFNASLDKLLLLDFTANNKELTDDILRDIHSFSLYINNQLNNAGARYGFGGYNEHRTVYSRSSVFDASSKGEEPRRLHLGIDIWGKPYTHVMAPLDAVVHSFGFNDQMGDYGGTLILVHQLDGVIFHTLYGHLSHNSIKNISAGDRVAKADIIAEFGIPSENGQWPPHLHFQLILDMNEWKGDYPGVCKYSEREKWLANSPDPDLILQMRQYC